MGVVYGTKIHVPFIFGKIQNSKWPPGTHIVPSSLRRILSRNFWNFTFILCRHVQNTKLQVPFVFGQYRLKNGQTAGVQSWVFAILGHVGNKTQKP